MKINFLIIYQIYYEDLLNLIDETYIIKDAFTYVSSIDTHNNNININENLDLNNIVLKGKFVNFPLSSYNQVINKICNINELKNKNTSKEKYIIIQNPIYFNDSNNVKQAYIIY